MASYYYFYVLYCQDDTFYGGFTTDLAKREASHNAGKGAKYTRVKKRQPVRVIYAERYDDKVSAMQAEYRFKQLTRLEKEAYLKSQGMKDWTSGQMLMVTRPEEGDEDETEKL